MGKIPQGILGGVSGKIGGVVGSSWKGINVLKTKPLSVANPRTAGQIAQRGRFSNVVAFAQGILSEIIKPLWDRFAGQMSGFNRFVSANIELFDNALPVLAADLVISTGRMASTIQTAFADFVAGSFSLSVTWDNDSGSGFKLDSDEAYIVVVNETTGQVFAASGATRLTGFQEVTFPEVLASGDVINAYLAFRRADGTVVSETSFRTETVA